MVYVPRLTEPSYDDPNYIHTSYGGKNNCIQIQGNSVLPNCVGYAFGRFMEILGSYPSLCKGNAGNWYGYVKDGYSRGLKPQLGAVACWSKQGAPGHVAIVEQINTDGSVVLSNSNYGGFRFRVEHVKPPNYINWKGFVFQGFIYNPAAESITDTRKQFIECAISHVSDNNEWICNTLGVPNTTPWNTLFILAVSKSIGGILGSVIPSVFSLSDIPRHGVALDMGKYILGPYHDNNSTPEIGDLVLIRNNEPFTYVNKDDYYADRIGIVSDLDTTNIYVVEGDCGDGAHSSTTTQLKSYRLNSKCINGYYRPDWTKVGGNITGSSGIYTGPLYDSVSTRADATIREVGYVSSNVEPSISSSDIKLSIVNYTTVLSALYDIGASRLQQSTVINSSSDMSNPCKVLIQYFISKGLNAAAAVGIAANVKHESNFKTDALGDYRNKYPTSFGICQWHAGRGDMMKSMAGSNWSNNLTGQLDYLWYELTNAYASVLSKLKRVSNNESGAKEAASIFVRQFEIPANPDIQSAKREATAVSMWKDITLILE